MCCFFFQLYISITKSHYWGVLAQVALEISIVLLICTEYMWMMADGYVNNGWGCVIGTYYSTTILQKNIHVHIRPLHYKIETFDNLLFKKSHVFIISGFPSLQKVFMHQNWIHSNYIFCLLTKSKKFGVNWPPFFHTGNVSCSKEILGLFSSSLGNGFVRVWVLVVNGFSIY